MSDRIAVMADGRILQEGSPREIYEHPGTRFVADFIGMSNFFVGEVVAQEQDRVLVHTTGSLKVWCASGGKSLPGSLVTVAVRPEKIEISTSPPTSAVNVWSGTVVAGTFLGEQTEFRVRIEDGRDVVIRRQNLGRNGLNQQVALGALVYLSWAPDVSLVLPRSA
jgi:ABC-type Fe3+/spermidine/putrescine transport system ATPase subunit